MSYIGEAAHPVPYAKVDLLGLSLGILADVLPAERARREQKDRLLAEDHAARLRKALAGYYARRFGVTLDPETEVVATLGSKEGFANVAQAITAPGDVVPILAALADDIARDLPEGRVAVTLPEGAVASRLDPDAFAVLARNLIENALRHGAPGTPVAVTLTPAGVLRVENDAPPVANPGMV